MSKRRWTAGELAMMTWDDNTGDAFPVLRGEGRWHMLNYIVSESDDFLTDAWLAERDGLTITPLATVDMEDPVEVERLARAYVIEAKSAPWNARSGADKAKVVRELQAALREFANPKPPIIEPTGLGAVVEDTQGRTWIRYLRPGTSAPWLWSEAPENCERLSVWSAIDAVAVLSEGVTP